MTELPERTTSAAKRLALVTLLAGIVVALFALVALPASASHSSSTQKHASRPSPSRTGQFVGPHATVAAVQGRERAPNYDSYATGSSVAAEDGAGLATSDGTNVIESSGRTFVSTPRGTVYDIPEGWVGRTADNGQGIVFQEPGAAGNADSIRIMDPTAQYPDGYVRYYNDQGQPLDVNGKPGPPSATHISQTYQGPWPGWP